MALLNFILNLLGLLLWLSWLSTRGRWKFLAGLLILLVGRAWVYCRLSPAARWTPHLDLGLVVLPFPGQFYSHMLLFSALSFGATLAVFYLCLLLLSVANHQVPDTDPLQKMVRLHLKWFERWPTPLKLLLPLLLGGIAWLALHPLLSHQGIVPPAKSAAQLLEQSAFIGAGSCLAWRYLIIGVLLLDLLNSHVYLAKHPLWNYLDITASNLLRPLRWLPLRVGRLDLLPLAVALLIFFASELIYSPPAWLPGWREWFNRRLPF